MERQFIIFAEEHTGDHFWYCTRNTECINLTPTSGNLNLGPFIDLEPVVEAMTNTKRFFTINKTRYKVVQRGTLYEP